ncbi:MAG: DNA glycosylase AlkZ-like family protein [Nocardioides sp.]
MVHQLSGEEARRIAVRAQWLTATRPTSLLDVADHLVPIQLNPTDVVAPSQHLVLWSRLGGRYIRDELDAVLAARELVEYRLHLYPAWYLALLRAQMDQWSQTDPTGSGWQASLARWAEANARCRRDILARLTLDGPTAARNLPDTCAVPWESTGWTNDRNVQRLLDIMEVRGEVAVAHRTNGERQWDLAERVHPAEPAVAIEQAERQRREVRLRALGIARARTAERQVEPDDVGDVGESAVVDGVRGQWRIDPRYLDSATDDAVGFPARAALLSPLDRLVFDRRRMAQIFEFDYQLEMYKPKTKRRWGYFALPVLYGADLVGKLDATADHRAGVLRVDAVHEDHGWTDDVRQAVHDEVTQLSTWLDLDLSMG